MTAYRYDVSGLYIDDLKRFLEEDDPCGSFEKAPDALREPDKDRTGVLPHEAGGKTPDVLQAHAYFEGGKGAEEMPEPDRLPMRIDIIEMETMEQPRAIREFMLTGNQEKLREIDERIAELRGRLA